ncbi:MAG: site-specific integrase [Rhodospirillales bacterium]|nr:site-specific integrase [Rhodospirillales bacterium]
MPKAARPLTDYVVKSLTPAREQINWRGVSDGGCRGLLLRVSPRGEKAWAIRLTVNGKRVLHTIGAYPAVTLAEARTRAGGYLAASREGAAPSEIDARRSAESLTLTKAHALYVEAVKNGLRPQTITLKEGLFADHIMPLAGGRLLRKLRRADVMEVVEAVRAKGLAVQANRVFTELMAMLRWSEQKGFIAGVPTFHKFKTREQPRSRTLTDGEVGDVWEKVAGLGDLTRDFVRLLLITGQRRDDVRLMRWDEIDLDANLWTIPASRYKTRIDHCVPLSSPALGILRARRPENAIGYVLAGRDGKPFNGAASSMRRLREAVTGKGDFSLHDLRRTCRSGLSRLGVDAATAELVIGHTPQGIVRVYDRHARMVERIDALSRWAGFVLSVAGQRGPNVVVWKTS